MTACRALITFALLLIATTAQAGKQDKRLDIYWVDVEGGAATLIVTPAGQSVLIDAGNPGHRDPDRIVQTAAKAAGVQRIDHLITTHYHGDHYGGAAMLSTLMPIGHVHDNGEFEGGRERPDKAYLEFKAEQRSVISPGDLIKLEQADGSAKLQIKCLCARQKTIAPPTDGSLNDCCADSKSKPVDNSDNANSVVVLVSFGDFDFYDGGDLTWNVEKLLVCPTNLVGVVDVYQATHHGLDASNNPVLVRSLQPTVAVINNGTTKGCEPNTFATLKELSSIKTIYQGHRNLRMDSENNTAAELIANHEKECKGEYIKLSVDPNGQSYTVSIPANKHEQTYKTK